MKRIKNKNLNRIIVAMLLIGIVFPSIKAEAKQADSKAVASKIVVIDPSGQENESYKREPIGPGAFKYSANVSADDTQAEYPLYELNLQIAQKLQDILASKGYEVILTRNSNDVDISESGRAMIANTSGADIFVVIDSTDTKGTSVVCQSNDNPYTYGNYNDGRLLSDSIFGSIAQNAKGSSSEVIESDEKPAINWCTIPTAIVEIGTQSDTAEADVDYQQELAQGIANGIDSYFSQK